MSRLGDYFLGTDTCRFYKRLERNYRIKNGHHFKTDGYKNTVEDLREAHFSAWYVKAVTNVLTLLSILTPLIHYSLPQEPSPSEGKLTCLLFCGTGVLLSEAFRFGFNFVTKKTRRKIEQQFNASFNDFLAERQI